jgi:hypothetical protein
MQAMDVLHHLLLYSLYGSEDPVGVFCELAKEYELHLADLIHRCSPEAIQRLFDKEEEIEANVDRIRLLGTDQEGATPIPEGYFGDLMKFHRKIYDCRKLLITKYIGEFKVSPSSYFIRKGELPLPPILFSSALRPLLGIPESQFKVISKECYVIRGQVERGNRVVLAGIRPYMGAAEPAIDFETADLNLLAYYWHRALFDNTVRDVYTPIIDEVYERLFKRSFFPSRSRLKKGKSGAGRKSGRKQRGKND